MLASANTVCTGRCQLGSVRVLDSQSAFASKTLIPSSARAGETKISP
ncbi:hypothetical protein IIA28_18750 [candidate division KSB1 bacterium]|nr:hypothetical protein [candidate division KSB1 bacterium]